ncbi:hypothetical protein Mal48_42500 [Thalassoglobus polymorphus]|uniref:Uncharacterized protein n=1 Tax=Thalassoglobus polymorphus TaxID=2527994 RepID=A0A517QTV7_9PLAN|nr:hypothetical protein Mal48_42500 [Thalassoglobus polymorphus]
MIRQSLVVIGNNHDDGDVAKKAREFNDQVSPAKDMHEATGISKNTDRRRLSGCRDLDATGSEK